MSHSQLFKRVEIMVSKYGNLMLYQGIYQWVTPDIDFIDEAVVQCCVPVVKILVRCCSWRAISSCMECQVRLNEKCKPVLHCISSCEKLFLWKVIKCNHQFLYFFFYISFYNSRYYFLQLFRTSFNIIWKIVLSQVFLF